ncbi:glycogen synthase-related protein [Candidatus Uzinura diaspidicola str. ASNER]|uniref:starch synthase n=1 Tax=Candidatus Uzinura diaspidicola str. ASNER TaxID=1133592 RepID=L7VFW8_9FLAO|nr:glycogen synthase-related protein [Candidatus Uzinura diaspidicola str. ASNER]
MTKKRILYISSELFPYTSKSSISLKTSIIAKKMHFKGNDVRIFMPRYGIINERKHQLHEVIRLSGMKVIIKNIDKPMMIKVASIPEIRLQVYFIENEEFFKRKGIYSDSLGSSFEDERMLFFTKSVIYAIKKLSWSPDILHIHGWLGACIPLYIKTYYKGDPLFKKTKIVSSIYNENFEKQISIDLIKKIKLDGIKNKSLKHIEKPYLRNLIKLAIDNSDLIIKEDKYVHSEIEYYINLKHA